MKSNIITALVTLLVFSLIALVIYYKPTKKLISSENISFTVLMDKKRGVFLRNNKTNKSEWHNSQKRCTIEEGATHSLPLYTYHLVDNDGEFVKKIIETDRDEVSRAFCK